MSGFIRPDGVVPSYHAFPTIDIGPILGPWFSFSQEQCQAANSPSSSNSGKKKKAGCELNRQTYDEMPEVELKKYI